MSNEQKQNENQKPPAIPSELSSVAAQAYINDAIRKGVQEAMQGMFAGFGTTLSDAIQAVALTPEKLLKMEEMRRAPDAALVAREAREKAQSKAQDLENQRNLELRQKNCGHRDKNGKDAINLVHNHPDHNPRGVCPLCHVWITPREWRIGAPGSHGRADGAYLVDESPDYGRVRVLESMS